MNKRKGLDWSNFLSSQTEDYLAISQWLLLKIINKANRGITTEKIYQYLRKINDKNPPFLILWSFGYSLNDVILAQEEFGFIKRLEQRQKKDVWHITDKGKNILEQNRTFIEQHDFDLMQFPFFK